MERVCYSTALIKNTRKMLISLGPEEITGIFGAK
jgi:hypothetical protein